LTIQVRVTGGFGNQLFKFFHGVDLSNTYNENLIIDKTWYRDSRDRRNLVSERSFDLGYYPKIREVASVEWRSNRLHKVFGQVLRRSHPLVQLKLGYLVESNRVRFLNDSRIPSIVDGSFEQLDCLPESEIILDYLNPPSDSEWLKTSTFEISAAQPIALHVRRGDFLNIPHMYDVVKPTYYYDALKTIQGRYGPRPIHLFSDDPTAALEFLGKDFLIDHVVSQNSEVKTPEIFELLSRYPFLIGANSTFSWWAGYLGFLRGSTTLSTMPEKFLGEGFSDPSVKLRHSGTLVI
jgi:hypothetical protein